MGIKKGPVQKAAGLIGSLAGKAYAFRELRAARIRGRAPSIMPLFYIEVTQRCNCNCIHCGYAKEYPGEEKELTTEELKQYISDSLDLGTFLVSFGGGEPFIRPDLPELIAHGHTLGMSMHVNTNGTLLTEKLIGELVGFDRLSLTMSIDHPDEAVNDRIRGAGVFARVGEAAERLQRLAPNIGRSLNCVIGPHNLGQLENMMELGAKWGFEAVRFTPTHSNLNHQWKSEPISPSMFFTRNDFAGLTEELKRVLKKADELGIGTSSEAFLMRIPDALSGGPTLPCYAGYVYGNLDPYGNFFPCYDYIEPLNLRDTPLKDAWKSPAMQRMRAQVRACNHACWCTGNAEPSIRMDLQTILTHPKMILSDLGFYRL